MTFIQFGNKEQCERNYVSKNHVYAFLVSNQSNRDYGYWFNNDTWSVEKRYRTTFKLELVGLKSTKIPDDEFPF